MAQTKHQARMEAEDIVQQWMVGQVLIAIVPGGNLINMLCDMVMIRHVADVFGVGVFNEAAVISHLEGLIISTFGTTVIGFIPIVGAIFFAPKVRIIGDAVIDYFYRASPLPD